VLFNRVIISHQNKTKIDLRPRTKSMMASFHARLSIALFLLWLSVCPIKALQNRSSDKEFGPVVRAYLGYLKNEQEVVDDRASRREISASYYRRNSNRIRALRQMAIKLARESHNDYLPELEAVAADEMGLLFERPPQPTKLRPGELLANKLRFLGAVKSVEVFYVFARLDPFDQAEPPSKTVPKPAPRAISPDSEVSTPVTRSRRVTP
jgi:hypothetical protein